MRLLRLLLPEHRYSAVLGDLEEEFATGYRSRLWYWKEVIVIITHSLSRWIGFAISAGLIAGTTMSTLDLTRQRPLFIMLPYAAVVIGTAVLLRMRSELPYFARFGILLTAFLTATFVLDFGLNLNPNVSPKSLAFHAALFGIMFGIGSITAASAALVSGRDANRYLSALALGVLGAGAMFISMRWMNLIPMAVAFALLVAASALVLRQTSRPARVALSLVAWAIAAGLTLLTYAAIARRPGDFSRLLDAIWLRSLIAIVVGSIAVAASGKPTRLPVSN